LARAASGRLPAGSRLETEFNEAFINTPFAFVMIALPATMVFPAGTRTRKIRALFLI
jgi:hypothetical protein